MQFWFVLLFFLLSPFAASAEEINAGFVRGLWYSDDSIFAGETVRVYVAIRNNTDADLTGTVTFFDNDKKIGTQTVAALDGRLIESWIDWVPAYGEHTLRAELSRMKLSAVGSEAENVAVAVATASDTLFSDYDTDEDGTGNTTDTDDDNDDVSDVAETENKTNPLVKNKSVETAASTTTERSTATTAPTISTRATTAEGLERYLTPSRADTLLTGVTTWASSTKARLDSYREARREDNVAAAPEVTVNNDGFGEITRTHAEDAASSSDVAGQGIIDSLIHVIGSILGAILTAILAVLSWTLGYAMLIQLLILVGILTGTYFTARKFGSRPTKKKK
jgi:hypothetical protein